MSRWRRRPSALLAAIGELTKGKTLITIAHRLSTVRAADQVLVIDIGLSHHPGGATQENMPVPDNERATRIRME